MDLPLLNEREMMRRRRIYDVVETIWQSTVWEGGTAQNSSQKFLSRGVESTVQSHTMQFLDVSASLEPTLRVSALLQWTAIW